MVVYFGQRLLSHHGHPRPNPATLTVFAAASTTDALQELARGYERTHAVQIQFNFASSGTLAQQIAAGAPVDLFVSADDQWMNYLKARELIDARSQCNLLTNQLVLIAPAGQAFPVKITRGFDFAGAFAGRLAIGDPDYVPAGRYAKQALTSLNWYASLRERLLPFSDVRAVLAAVEQGEVAAGIVYASDARISSKVTVIGVFPERTHQPIRYPVAVSRQAAPNAAALLAYLSGPDARRIFTKYGFTAGVAAGKGK